MNSNYEQMMLKEFERQKSWLEDKDKQHIFTSFLLNALKMKTVDVEYRFSAQSVKPIVDVATSVKKVIEEFGKEEHWLTQEAIGWKQKLEGIWGKCFERSPIKYVDDSEEDQKKMMKRKGRLLLGGSEVLACSSNLIAGDEMRHFALTVAMQQLMPHCYLSFIYVFARWSETDEARVELFKKSWDETSVPEDLEDLFLRKLSIRIHGINQYKHKERFDKEMKLRSMKLDKDFRKELSPCISKGDLWDVAKMAVGTLMSLHVREYPSQDIKIKKLQLDFKMVNMTDTCPLLTVYYSPIAKKLFRMNDIVSLVLLRLYFQKHFDWILSLFNLDLLKCSMTDSPKIVTESQTQPRADETALQRSKEHSPLQLPSPEDLEDQQSVDIVAIIQEEVKDFHDSILLDLYSLMHQDRPTSRTEEIDTHTDEWLSELASKVAAFSCGGYQPQQASPTQR